MILQSKMNSAAFEPSSLQPSSRLYLGGTAKINELKRAITLEATISFKKLGTSYKTLEKVHHELRCEFLTQLYGLRLINCIASSVVLECVAFAYQNEKKG